jgi:hypothetical protein
MANETSFTPPAVRDKFLASLDEASTLNAATLALNLTTSRNPLPGMTCQQLGLPLGSSYAAAAKLVLERHFERRRQ